jgi:hypothetical protein
MLRIYLLQLGHIRRPLVEKILPESVKLTYMGQAQYEDEAQPRSLAAMAAAKEEMRLIAFPQIRLADGRELIAYGNFSDETYTAYAAELALVAEKKRQTHDGNHFAELLALPNVPPTVSPENRESWIARLSDFWWDLDNHVIMSFDLDFMALLPSILKKTYAYLNLHAETDQSQRASTPASGEPEVGKDYDGKVVVLLRRKGRVHSYLVDVGFPKAGRLGIEQVKDGRELKKGDPVRVRVIHKNEYDNKFVVSETQVV